MESEAKEIIKVINKDFPNSLDGKQCILDLKARGSRNWRQMEWMGFYTEEVVRDLLIVKIGGSIGPRYGNTTIDYERNFVWDIKIHSLMDKSGNDTKWAILNDDEAIRGVIDDYGTIGFILAKAEALYDLTGEFKFWHDRLKGKTSRYVQERIARGAPSRVRKSSATIQEWVLFNFDNNASIETGISEGWLSYFQEGMRNADGSPRRPKIMIKVNEIPSERLISL